VDSLRSFGGFDAMSLKLMVLVLVVARFGDYAHQRVADVTLLLLVSGSH
jgi:hypothetical protein